MKSSTTLFVLALVFAFAETIYFGSHFWPSCAAELICDGIATLILALGLVARSVERK